MDSKLVNIPKVEFISEYLESAISKAKQEIEDSNEEMLENLKDITAIQSTIKKHEKKMSKLEEKVENMPQVGNVNIPKDVVSLQAMS